MATQMEGIFFHALLSPDLGSQFGVLHWKEKHLATSNSQFIS